MLKTWNTSLDVYSNVKSNIMADIMAKNRWGNKFKKLFLRHIGTAYGEYPAYFFTDGMRDCTNAEGSTAERLEDAIAFKEELEKIDESAVFNLIVRDNSYDDGINVTHDVLIKSIVCIVNDEETDFDDQDGKVKEYLREMILDESLFDFTPTTIYLDIEMTISLVDFLEYINNEIEELQNIVDTPSRANDDLELINHLGLCETLANEISKPWKIRSIYFRFQKKVSPTEIYENGLFVGYDPNYAWWEEEQFAEIKKHVKNFRDYCTFVVGVDDGSTAGTFTPSYVYVDASIFSLSGHKIYWFVKAFLDIDYRAKHSFFSDLLGAFGLIIGIGLTLITANPAWVKIILIGLAIGSYSGALSPKAQLFLTAVLFAYGLSSTNLTSMSSTQLFNWAIKNIEMVFKMVQLYETTRLETDTKENVAEHEVQEQAMQFIYTDAYSQYDNFYSVMYDYEPK